MLEQVVCVEVNLQRTISKREANPEQRSSGVSRTVEGSKGRRLQLTSCTYCVDAVELLGSVQQNNGEQLPADAAVGEELPRPLGLDTCCTVPLLLDVVPLSLTCVAVQQPEGFAQESTRALAVTAASATCLLSAAPLPSDQAARL